MKHRKPAERAAAIAAWRASGEAADTWAVQAGLVPATFARWRAEAARGSEAATTLQFVRLPASAAVGAGLTREWTVEVGEVRVRLSRGTAWDDVSRLLVALRSTP